MTTRKFSELDPRRQLEQEVSKQLDAALTKRGVSVKHHGTAATNAPSTAPADITLTWKKGNTRYTVLIEVALRRNETEYGPIVAHLDNMIAQGNKRVNVIYAGTATSARLVRMIRNENKRRQDNRIAGRIIFIRLDDLQELLIHWASQDKEYYPIEIIQELFDRWMDFTNDLNAFRVFQETIFPSWKEKNGEIQKDIQRGAIVRQERLRTDIIKLENQLREMGLMGQRAHKILIYLFFLALYEDRRGPSSRFSLEGFHYYKDNIPSADKNSAEYKDRSAHHLFTKEIMADPDIVTSGMMDQYEKIDLSDGFILSKVLPIFEGYTFSDKSMDIIGAVFEALARRAEKDNRIGQFFTPETVVEATTLLVRPRPSDLVADPACGTGRFLIYAMDIMLSQTDTVTDMTVEEAQRQVRQHKLIGVDVDPWIATIAKMNMYIHGDGKSNIKQGNGLTLSSSNLFSPQVSGTLKGEIDIVLTNPPLGDINFRELSLALARHQLLGTANDTRSVEELASRWTNENLAVVPHVCIELEQEEELVKRLQTWREKERVAQLENDEKALRQALRFREQAEAKLKEIQQKIGAKNFTYRPSGATAKGGVLFLSAIKDYLRPVRLKQARSEWRGGAVGIVIDEAVLNTSEYAMAREYLCKYFFIKAIISLPRDAFEHVAKTTAKTSILFLIRKEDEAVQQREPIFYAQVQTTEYQNDGKLVENELKAVNAAFNNWRNVIMLSYQSNGPFERRLFEQHKDQLVSLNTLFWAYFLSQDMSERLNFAYKRMLDEVGKMRNATTLGTIVDPIVVIPKEHPTYRFATVSRLDGRVRVKGETVTKYLPFELRIVESGDIILSGIDLVNGAVGVVADDADGCVVSKEYYVLRIKSNMMGGVAPEYIAALLRTTKMLIIIEGIVTGLSNRTRIEDINTLLNLPIPSLPTIEQQKSYAEKVSRAFHLQDEASRTLVEVQRGISTDLWES